MIVFPVFSIGRSGSSMVAGVLDRLGVDMGTNLENWNSPEYNPKGFFEDSQLGDIHKAILRECHVADFGQMTVARADNLIHRYEGDYRRIIAARSDRSAMWGAKDPRFCFFGRSFLRIVSEFSEPRVVVAHRQPSAQQLSSMRFHLQGKVSSEVQTAKDVMDNTAHMWASHRQIMDDYVHPKQIKTFIVDYDHAVEHPEELVEKLAAWVYDGTGKSASLEQISAAVEMIDPELRNFK